MFNRKQKKLIATIICIILVACMIIPLVLSGFGY